MNKKRAELRRKMKEGEDVGTDERNEEAAILALRDDPSWKLATTKDRNIERESINEFICKKREMFLLQYSLAVKRDEIRKLDEGAAAEERKLEKAEQYLEEDTAMFDEFLKENDKNSVEAIKIAEQEAKVKLEKVSEIKKISTKMVSLKSDISKHEEILKEYMMYKDAPAVEEKALWPKNQDSKQSEYVRHYINTTINFKSALFKTKLKPKTQPEPQPYAGAVGPGFLLVQNNARPNVARVCRQFLDDEDIDDIDWPSRSPDLNPIENLWEVMYRCIQRHQVAPQTAQELTDALIQVWEEIPQDTIRCLIRSMPKRCQECIQAELFFTEPQQLLDILTELEEQNLSLIQNSRETEEALEEFKHTMSNTHQKMNQETEILKQQIDVLKDTIDRERERAAELELKARLFSYGQFKGEDQDDMMERLEKKVGEVYRTCIGDNEANLSALQMLTSIESRLDELFENIEMIPREKVQLAEKVKEKERRLRSVLHQSLVQMLVWPSQC
ncbi:CP100 protein, partial [Amia calva]|nr:CP100 protein [Amia calva]